MYREYFLFLPLEPRKFDPRPSGSFVNWVVNDRVLGAREGIRTFAHLKLETMSIVTMYFHMHYDLIESNGPFPNFAKDLEPYVSLYQTPDAKLWNLTRWQLSSFVPNNQKPPAQLWVENGLRGLQTCGSECRILLVAIILRAANSQIKA